MSERKYICKIIGTGSGPGDAYRPAVSDVLDPDTGMPAFEVKAAIRTDASGAPVEDWCLAVCRGELHSLVRSAQPGQPTWTPADIDDLPDFPLDSKVGSMHKLTRDQMSAKFLARGIDVGLISRADGFRDVVRGLGKIQEDAFEEDDFTFE